MKTTYPLTTKGQITVPKRIRDHLGLKPGDQAAFRIGSNGEVTLRRPRTPAQIRKSVGPPTGKQPLSSKEQLMGEYLTKKYDVC